MKKNHLKTRGIIVRKVNYSENDIIFDVLNEDGEIIGFFGRSARKIKSRLVSVLQLGNVVNITYSVGKNLNYPSEVEIDRTNIFSFYSKSIEGMRFYSDVIKIISIISKDYHSPDIFELTIKAFQDAESGGKLTEVYNEFLSELLQILGYETEIKCFFSGEVINEKEFFYHPETNRVFSSKNKPKTLDIPQISFDQTFFKNYLQKLFMEHVRQRMKFKF